MKPCFIPYLKTEIIHEILFRNHSNNFQMFEMSFWERHKLPNTLPIKGLVHLQNNTRRIRICNYTRLPKLNELLRLGIKSAKTQVHTTNIQISQMSSNQTPTIAPCITNVTVSRPTMMEKIKPVLSFSKITKLHLNWIFNLFSYAFKGLGRLKELNLNNQQTKRLHFKGKSVFKVTKKLKILRLAQNGITSLPKGLFFGMLELELLDLSGNELKNVDM